MKTIFLIVTLLSIVAVCEGDVTEGNSHPSFFRSGDNPLTIFTMKSAVDKDALLMGIDPGCVLIQVNLVKKEGMIYTYRIVGSPGGAGMVDWAKKIMGLERNEFKITTKEVTSKVGGADISRLIITSIANEPTTSEQDGTGQHTARPESKSEGSDKPQPESEGRSR